MSLFMRDALGRLVPVNPGLPVARGNQGGMGRRLDEADLMSRLPDADIVGAIGPGVVPGGEQAVGARRANLAQEDALPPAATYRPLSGAQQNNRGNSRQVTLHTQGGGPIQTVPSVVETSKSAGDDAEVITIQLGMDIPSQFQDLTSDYSGVLIDVTAIVEWGVGNAFFSAEVDWNQGTSFAVCASFCRVSARVAAIVDASAPNLDIVLRASLAYGNASTLNNSSPARRTVRIGNVDDPLSPDQTTIPAGGFSAAIPIPVWAMGFTLNDAWAGDSFATVVEPDYTIFLFNEAGGNPVASYSLETRSNEGLQTEGQFPVPGSARFIQVKNNLGLVVHNPKLIFNLGM